MSSMASLVHKGDQSSNTRSHRRRGSQGREVGLRWDPRAVAFFVRRNGPMAEPVAVLELSITQVEVHGRAFVVDTHCSKRSSPHRRCAFEGEVRVLLLVHVTRQSVPQVPRFQRVLALVRLDPLQGCHHQRPSLLLQHVQHLEQTSLVESLSLGHLEVVEVLVPELLGHGVSSLDYGHKVRSDEFTNPAHALVAQLSNLNIVVRAHGGSQQHRGSADELFGGGVGVPKLQVGAVVLQLALHGRQLVLQALSLLTLHDVAQESLLHNLQNLELLF
mmetsp:Transcript_38638/g.74070  ORF Transcript_38638/g.74070 Transcript_38638/m.74070 type:complete len:274 (+) Transcript_38638:999-1820(+)